MTVEASSRGRSNRRRGGDAERAVVAFLRSQGFPDARRYLAGDGRQPGDIDFHPLICLEVKSRRESSWPSWCRQATAEARDGMIPVVVRKTAPMDRAGEWEARTPADAWVGLRHRWPGVFWVAGEPWVSTTLAGIVAAVAAIDQDVTT